MSPDERRKNASVARLATSVKRREKRSKTSISLVSILKKCMPRNSKIFTTTTAHIKTNASVRIVFLLFSRKELNIIKTPQTAEKINTFILFYNDIGNIYFPEKTVNKAICQV